MQRTRYFSDDLIGSSFQMDLAMELEDGTNFEYYVNQYNTGEDFEGSISICFYASDAKGKVLAEYNYSPEEYYEEDDDGSFCDITYFEEYIAMKEILDCETPNELIEAIHKPFFGAGIFFEKEYGIMTAVDMVKTSEKLLKKHLSSLADIKSLVINKGFRNREIDGFDYIMRNIGLDHITRIVQKAKSCEDRLAELYASESFRHFTDEAGAKIINYYDKFKTPKKAIEQTIISQILNPDKSISLEIILDGENIESDIDSVKSQKALKKKGGIELGKYCFCAVAMLGSSSEVYYISEDPNVKVGDYVAVPWGGIVSYGEVKEVEICTEKKAPVNAALVDKIIKKISSAEYEKNKLLQCRHALFKEDSDCDHDGDLAEEIFDSAIYKKSYDQATGILMFETEVTETAYEGRSERIESIKEGKNVKLKRDLDNSYDKNALGVYNTKGESLGNMPIDIAAILSPLIDGKLVKIESAKASYVELTSQRGKRARKSMLRIEVCVKCNDARDCFW